MANEIIAEITPLANPIERFVANQIGSEISLNKPVIKIIIRLNPPTMYPATIISVLLYFLNACMLPFFLCFCRCNKFCLILHLRSALHVIFLWLLFLKAAFHFGIIFFHFVFVCGFASVLPPSAIFCCRFSRNCEA